MNLKSKKIPMRKCVICGERFDKRQMIRILVNENGNLEIDTTGKKNGRGAYLCSSRNCMKDKKTIVKLCRSLGVEIREECGNELMEYFSNIPDAEVLVDED